MDALGDAQHRGLRLRRFAPPFLPSEEAISERAVVAAHTRDSLSR